MILLATPFPPALDHLGQNELEARRSSLPLRPQHFHHRSIGHPRPAWPARVQVTTLSLHAYHLLQRVDDLNEVGLRRHHRVDVLVRTRRLV